MKAFVKLPLIFYAPRFSRYLSPTKVVYDCHLPALPTLANLAASSVPSFGRTLVASPMIDLFLTLLFGFNTPYFNYL